MAGKISAIIPVYNTPAEFLRICVQSMLSQSHQDSQIILVDDGSQEPTARLCDELAATDNRVEVFHQTNAGPSIARNNGIQRASGEYLTFVDSDDTLLPGAWQKAIRQMEAYQADCVVFGWLDNEAGKPVPRRVADGPVCLPAGEAVCQIAADNIACGGGYPWNKVWRVSALKGVNGALPLFDANLFTYEDKDWTLRALEGSHTLLLLPDILYDYRFVPSSLTKSEESWKRRQYNAYTAYDRIIDYLRPRNLAAWRGAVNFYFAFCATDLMNQVRHFPHYGWERCNQTRKSLAQLCSRIHAGDLDGRRRKCIWAFMKLLGV